MQFKLNCNEFPKKVNSEQLLHGKLLMLMKINPFQVIYPKLSIN